MCRPNDTGYEDNGAGGAAWDAMRQLGLYSSPRSANIME